MNQDHIPDPYVEVARRMRELRQKSGMSLSEMADKLGMTKPSLWEIETCKVGIRSTTLLRAARILGVKAVDFFIERREFEEMLHRPPACLGEARMLKKALHSTEFVEFAGSLADIYLHQRSVFREFARAVGVFLDGCSAVRRRTARPAKK